MKKTSLFKTIKEYWKIPRYHGLMSLGLYILFFFCLYLFTQPWNQSVPAQNRSYQIQPPYTVEYSFVETSDTITNHLFELSATEDSKTLIYKNTGETYTIIDNRLIGSKTELNEILPIPIVGLFPETIMAFLEEKIPVSNGTYQDGTTKKEYEIKASEMALFGSTNENYVLITTYTKNDKLEKIDMNITKALDNPNISSYNIGLIYHS